MTFPAAAGCFGCEMAAFIPPVPLAPAELARRLPRRGSCSERLSTLPLCAAQPQGGEQEQDDDDEDIPNLYRVTAAPTYEEMLAWAEETDKRIATGRLPPLGSRPAPSAAGAAGAAAGDGLLSGQEQAQMETLAGLLSKRRREGGRLSEQEGASLRAAVAGLSSSVDSTDDESVDGSSSSPDFAGDGDGGEAAPDGAETEDLVRNQIYGSREVRDKVYLYAWSVMKNRQEQAERDAEEQERQRPR